MRRAVVTAITGALAAGACTAPLAAPLLLPPGKGGGTRYSGPVSLVAEARSAPDAWAPDGGGVRWTTELMVRPIIRDHGHTRVIPAHDGRYLRFESAAGYTSDGGVYLTDGFQVGHAASRGHSFFALGFGPRWGGVRLTSLGATVGVHALLFDTIALDDDGGVRIPRTDDDGVSGPLGGSLGARVFVPAGKARAALGLQLLREDGHTYALFSLGVESFVEY